MAAIYQIKARKGEDPENFDEAIARVDMGETFDVFVLGKPKAILTQASALEVPSEPELFE